MYRQRTVETETMDEQFVSRLYDLPVVNSAWGKLGAFYTGTKEHNRLFRFTLETAESGLGLVVNTAKPVVAKFEKPIGTLNGLACQKLEKLEHDYPIITKPTDIVLKQTLEAVKPITDRVKPITDCVGSATHYGATKINDVKVYTVDTIGGVKTYGVNKVNGVKLYSIDKVNGAKSFGIDKFNAVTDMGTKQVSRMLENQTGRAIIAQVDRAIDIADSYVDKYLPEEADSVQEKKSPLKAVTGNKMAPSKAKKIELDEASQQGVVMTKAVELGSKIRRRAYVHAAKQLKTMKLRSLETVDKLRFTVDLMEYARTNLDGVKTKVHYVWDEINKSPEELSKESSEQEQNAKNLTYERRAIATARHLTQKLKVGLSGLHLSMEMVPAPVRAQAQRALDLAQSLFNMFTSRAKTGLSNEDMETVRGSIGQLRTTLGNMAGWNPSSSLKTSPHECTGAVNDQRGEWTAFTDTTVKTMIDDPPHELRNSENRDECDRHHEDEENHCED